MAQVAGWLLDPAITFLNHGSYGAVPRQVLDRRQRLAERIEADPVRFLAFEFPELLSAARHTAAAFVGADPAGFAFVANATAGVNTALRSAPIEPGDEILVTDHGYEACTLAAEYVAARRGATVVTARIPVPLPGPAAAREAVLAAVTPATRWAVIDHITSPTALVLPIAEIVEDLAARGVRTIVDGAHAPGQVELDIDALGAAAYAGNWHKWTCAPRGAGFLWVAPDWRETVRPLVISHGAGHRGTEGERFRATFDWTGTGDMTPFLMVPDALEVVGDLHPDGWPGVRRHNAATAAALAARIADEVGLERVAPPAMNAAMVSFRVPADVMPVRGGDGARLLQQRLMEEFAVVVGTAARRGTDDVYLRISAHAHTDPGAAGPLIDALRALASRR